MMKTDYEIRRAEVRDGDGLLSLISGLAEYENLEPPDEKARQRLLEDAFGEVPKFEAWLAFVPEREEAVGMVVLLSTYSTFLARPSLYIEDVFVFPEFRGRGIGGALLRKAVELARERGCGRVEWTALDWNVNAQKVYEEKMGARHMKEWFLYRMTGVEMDRFLSAGG
ncbi:GNAT family N-acetyltransferase [Phragmitibacter flavus]|uniref:GNAT family N-acetyltransferase n=1 Tax=Phragmitibacter flavus TaxID=2576071 RepID=A0A5R8KFQ5_9BACT|nr:GNAT family N-acetyltransferase [Phragmitibacter flavus]TLD71071.1 GNAT family N-acetyltransferase [Phragmitibacter flavus]